MYTVGERKSISKVLINIAAGTRFILRTGGYGYTHEIINYPTLSTAGAEGRNTRADRFLPEYLRSGTVLFATNE